MSAAGIAGYVVSIENPTVSDARIRTAKARKKLQTSGIPSLPEMEFLFRKHWFSELKEKKVSVTNSKRLPRPQFTIVSVITSNGKPNQSLVTIKSQNNTHVLGLGEGLNGYLLTTVNPNRVIFEKGGTKFVFSVASSLKGPN